MKKIMSGFLVIFGLSLTAGSASADKGPDILDDLKSNEINMMEMEKRLSFRGEEFIGPNWNNVRNQVITYCQNAPPKRVCLPEFTWANLADGNKQWKQKYLRHRTGKRPKTYWRSY